MLQLKLHLGLFYSVNIVYHTLHVVTQLNLISVEISCSIQECILTIGDCSYLHFKETIDIVIPFRFCVVKRGKRKTARIIER